MLVVAMDLIFTNTPKWSDVDLDTLGFSGWFIVLGDAEFAVRAPLAKSGMWLKALDIPANFTEKLMTMNVVLKQNVIYVSPKVVLLDKYGVQFEADESIIQMLVGAMPSEAVLILDIYLNDIEDDGLVPEVDDDGPYTYILSASAIRFPAYASPLGRVCERVGYMEEVLNLPHHLGSVKGWVQLMQANWGSCSSTNERQVEGPPQYGPHAEQDTCHRDRESKSLKAVQASVAARS